MTPIKKTRLARSVQGTRTGARRSELIVCPHPTRGNLSRVHTTRLEEIHGHTKLHNILPAGNLDRSTDNVTFPRYK